jgi:hypothetical protein
MLFNRKPAYFLDLGSEGATPATVAIAKAKPNPDKPNPAKSSSAKPSPSKPSANPAAPEPVAAAEPGPALQTSLTTAEAIAAELRAAQEGMPPPSNATFAPDCLNPANALPSRRRLAGANLAGFKAMASGMFRN